MGFNYSLIASSDSGKLIVKDNFIENELDKDYLKKYSINVGTRQQGRHMPNNVINIPFEKKRIINEINKRII